MYNPDCDKALILAQKIHKEYRLKVNTSIKDVKLAIYYLQGGCITQANLALKAWAAGDLNAPFRTKRFIDECKILIFCLILVNHEDRDRYIKHFFKDEILTINVAKHKEEIIKKFGMTEGYFDDFLKNSATLSHGFSKGVHPNLTSVAYNSDVDTGVFDYNLESFAYYPIEGFDFGHFITIPLIDCVSLPSALFELKAEDLSEISQLRERIQATAIENHVKSKVS